MRQGLFPALLAVALLLPACGKTVNLEEALRINELTFAERQMQTRRFETPDEMIMLVAVARLLQDLGFILDESETRLGVVVGSKVRGAWDAEQFVVALLKNMVFIPTKAEYMQKLRASIATRPVGENGEYIAVRVTFQRIVWDTDNKMSRAEAMKDPVQYQKFFSKLSKAVFLEAHEI